MAGKKFIPLPIRLNGNNFVSEIFLLARIISENLQTLGVGVKKYQMFMLAANKKLANINIQLNDDRNVIISIDATDAPRGASIYFSVSKKIEICTYVDFEKKSEICSYTNFRHIGFLGLVNTIKD